MAPHRSRTPSDVANEFQGALIVMSSVNPLVTDAAVITLAVASWKTTADAVLALQGSVTVTVKLT